MARKPLSTSLVIIYFITFLTCCWSGPVFPDEERIEALEARIVELENLVHQLVQNQVETRIAELPDKHPDTVADITSQHSYKFSGYIKADAIYSDYSGGSVASGNAGRDFYIPATVPVGDNGESYLDLHAKESRLNFSTSHILDNGTRLGTMIEIDFLVSSQGDDRISNSYSPRLRQAFATYNNWLFGQTWMTLFNVSALPENLDFIGPSESTIFGRQAMIRYSNGPWQFALENPETTITPFNGGERIIADDNQLPDAILRYNLKSEWGSFSVAGILRQLACVNNETGVDDSTVGYGISLSGKIEFDNKDDFRWMASAGRGFGRYIGLNTANGAVLDEHGQLHAIDSTGIFGSYRHLWNDKWRSNLTLGYLSVDNDTGLTGTGVTKTASSFHFNLIYSPQPRLDFGAELMYAKREIESGDEGDLTRLQFSAKYAF